MRKIVVSFLVAAAALDAGAVDVKVVPVSRAVVGGDACEIADVRSGVGFGRVMRDRSGCVATSFVNPLVSPLRAVSAGPGAPVRVSSAEGCALYEDFEDAPANYVWMPEGWTTECKDSKSHSASDEGLKGTWTVSSYMPHSGKYSARVQIDWVYDENGDLVFNTSHYQDEWLYTPVFTPEATDVMSFYFGFRPGRTLYNDKTNKFDAVNNVTEMYISADGGETYEKIWDCLDYARSLTTEQLWDDCATIIATYINVSVAMADYAGKQVKVAFRYFGQNGESAMIDDFKVGKPDVQALYEAPLGTYFAGLDDNFNAALPGYAIAPTCGANSWENLSSPDSNIFGWTVGAFGGGELFSSDEVDLVFTPHGYTVGHQPVLTASAVGAEDSQYAFGGGEGYVTAFGGNCDDLFEHMTNARPVSAVGAAPYDIDAYGITNWGSFGGGTAFSDRASATAYLKGYDAILAMGVGQFYQQPAHPYYITRMDWFAENVECDPDAVFTLSLSKVVDGAPTADTYAVGYASGADIVTFEMDGHTYSRLPFRFVDGDGNPVKVEIDGSMYAFLDLTDTKIANFEALAQKVPSETGFAYGYYEYYGRYDFGDGDFYDIPEMESMRQTVDPEAGPLYCSYFVQTDATYTWLHADQTEISLSGDGETCEVEIDSYTPAAEWSVDAPDWLTCVPVDAADGRRLLKITAARCDAEARKGDVVVTIPASQLVISVSQAVSGIGSVDADVDAVVLDGTDLVVNGTYDISVYDPSGSCVLTAAVDGHSSVSLAHLAAGIYIVRYGTHAVRMALH